MDPKLFRESAKDLLRRFDPDNRRKAAKSRPFAVEKLGVSNSGKTTLMDRVYVDFKAAGAEVAKVPEGAEVITPPRNLPVYNFETADYTLAKVRRLAYDENVHLVLSDRAIMDMAVKLEVFAEDGVITSDEQRAFEATYLNRWNRALFDLHVWLVCDSETALSRKYGADHARRAAAGELKYSTTTNPQNLAKSLAAHRRVWDRLKLADDPYRHLWLDTSHLTPDEVAEAVKEAMLRAFSARLDADSAPPP